MNPIYQKLINSLKEAGYLKSSSIIQAFLKVDRALFVPKTLQDQAYWNAPLPIGYGQTVSQPLTVAFMLEKLGPKAGDKILDLGSGSGWQTALLAEIVGAKGKIFAVEIIPELLKIGKQNVRKLSYKIPTCETRLLPEPVEGIIVPNRQKFALQQKTQGINFRHLRYKNIKFHLAKPGILGWPAQAPFDKIIAAAAAKTLPQQLVNQLKPGGRMILPIQNSIWQIDKTRSGRIKKQEFPGFAFVPLV